MLRADLRAVRGGREITARLAVAPGETLIVSGPSGAGKTTILRALAGLLRPHAGTVACGDVTWLDRAAGVDLRPRERRVGVVVQEGALLPHLSAWRNVAFAADGPRGRRRAHALELLERLGVAHRADARPEALSGGERQRVAVARALARDPTALLLDEPFSALDRVAHDASASVLAAVVADLRVPTVLVSHDATDAELLGARVVELRAGRLVEGPPPTI